MAKESERIYTSEKQEKIGEVRIADEVVAIIAGLAATEVKGVAAMAGNATREIIERMGMKSLSKGVSVEVIDSTVSVKLSLNLEYGHSIPEVCAKVQERVKSAIENMTGLEVLDVNITIAGVNID
ncbi:Alkaline shock protein 23 [Clostridiales bacterium CHKCI001]|nr:Alkaline shock protein 23 [Clostridiales bacterium CHKCI001]